jgi:hypothetical protein
MHYVNIRTEDGYETVGAYSSQTQAAAAAREIREQEKQRNRYGRMSYQKKIKSVKVSRRATKDYYYFYGTVERKARRGKYCGC